MSETAGRRQVNSKTSVTAMEADQIWIYGTGFDKMAAIDVTTQWWSALGLSVDSETAMTAAR